MINGQKIFTTAAHVATHVWLACRTEPNAPKHRGISVLIVPIDSPGITVQPLWTQADSRTNMVYYDNVRVPVSSLVGKENEGWKVIMMALDFERAMSAADLRHAFDRLVEHAKTTQVDDQPLIRNPQVRRTLAQLAVDLEVCRLLALDVAWQVDQGVVPSTGFSMSKVWISELKERLANAGIEVLGPSGLLRPNDENSIAHGVFDRLYRGFPALKFAAGTNDVQRNIIAQRGLGLPRG
ncbi:MAG: acyl-CoA dehydrogenase family protein [Chloroflexi bacterium]|nr:acyl-CoA dehydrogenase family protein [Chloroflexota bacterium]